jgi:hypothetical protein
VNGSRDPARAGPLRAKRLLRRRWGGPLHGRDQHLKHDVGVRDAAGHSPRPWRARWVTRRPVGPTPCLAPQSSATTDLVDRTPRHSKPSGPLHHAAGHGRDAAHPLQGRRPSARRWRSKVYAERERISASATRQSAQRTWRSAAGAHYGHSCRGRGPRHPQQSITAVAGRERRGRHRSACGRPSAAAPCWAARREAGPRARDAGG